MQQKHWLSLKLVFKLVFKLTRRLATIVRRVAEARAEENRVTESTSEDKVNVAKLIEQTADRIAETTN